MSGYLQRLAASALRPAEAVHPVLGSVFSPQEGSGDHLSFPQEEDTALSVEGVPAPSVSPAQPSVETQQISSRSSNTPDSSAADIRSSSFQTIEPGLKSRAESGDSFEPLLPRLRNENSSPQTSPTQESLLAETRKPSLQPTHKALVSAGTGRSSPTIAGTRVLANSSSFRANERNATASPPANSEPDEIQIHIGRIEVTAVPPAPSRTSSKPQRKGISLDEYLKGRDRRA